MLLSIFWKEFPILSQKGAIWHLQVPPQLLSSPCPEGGAMTNLIGETGEHVFPRAPLFKGSNCCFENKGLFPFASWVLFGEIWINGGAAHVASSHPALGRIWVSAFLPHFLPSPWLGLEKWLSRPSQFRGGSMKLCPLLCLASRKVDRVIRSPFGSLFLSSMRRGHSFPPPPASAICALLKSAPFINNFSRPGHKMHVETNLALEWESV